MSGTGRRSIGIRYTTDGFDPSSGNPKNPKDGGVFVEVREGETHEDAVFKAIATQQLSKPFRGDEMITSFKVHHVDANRGNRYGFKDAAGYSVQELLQRPAIVRGNLYDVNMGHDAADETK